MLLKNVYMFAWILVIILGMILGTSATWVQYLNLTEYVEGVVSAAGVIIGLVLILLGCVMYIIKSYETNENNEIMFIYGFFKSIFN